MSRVRASRLSLIAACPLMLSIIVACSSDESGSLGGSGPGGNQPGPPTQDGGTAAPTPRPGEEDAGPDGSIEKDGSTPPACKKNLTVVATVAVPGSSKWKSNGCWKVVITEGTKWRKCTTAGADWQVANASAANYAYDDTNPNHGLQQENDYLAECSKNATGDGYEYMAYRGGWRLLDAPRLKATFAELYGSDLKDIDSLWFQNGIYKNNAALAAKPNVYPMINSGPPASANLQKKLGDDALAICKTVPDNGYFGVYNASWRETWEASDPRLLALQKALDTCTGL